MRIPLDRDDDDLDLLKIIILLFLISEFLQISPHTPLQGDYF
jgi:hypothetical protein